MPVVDDITRLRHIYDAATKAVQFTQGKSLPDFVSDELLGYALVRLMEIIGEAANGISDELKQKHPEIAWRQMSGMRNRLIHGYFEVNQEMVWKTNIRLAIIP